MPENFDREEAQRRADNYVVAAVRLIGASIEARNYGTAYDRVVRLLGVLPHNSGGQTLSPLFNVKLAEVTGVEPDVYDSDQMNEDR